MSIRKLALSIPAAFLSLGVVALSASASHATDNARDDYVNASSHVVPFTVTAHTYAKKKRHNLSRRSSDRYSGFGFRGDGFRFSGKYN